MFVSRFQIARGSNRLAPDWLGQHEEDAYDERRNVHPDLSCWIFE
jgi:hypothetical protein